MSDGKFDTKFTPAERWKVAGLIAVVVVVLAGVSACGNASESNYDGPDVTCVYGARGEEVCG